MKILLDTHYLLWAFIDTGKIPKNVYASLLTEENEVYYSQASLWEIAIKYRLGKLELRGLPPKERLTPEAFFEEVSDSYLECLPLRNDDLVSSWRLPVEHKDPFDRIMIWQAIRSGFHFLSVDGQAEKYAKYGLKLLT